MYKGSPKAHVQGLVGTNAPIELLRQKEKGKEIELLGTTSLIVKVVDEQRKLQFAKDITRVPPSLTYVDPSKQKSYAYKELTGGLFTSAKKLDEMLPKAFKGNQPGFIKDLNQKFKAYMNL